MWQQWKKEAHACCLVFYCLLMTHLTFICTLAFLNMTGMMAVNGWPEFQSPCVSFIPWLKNASMTEWAFDCALFAAKLITCSVSEGELWECSLVSSYSNVAAESSVRSADGFRIVFLIISTLSIGNSSTFHRGCVNVLSRSWFSSILSFVNDAIAIIFWQRHLKSSMFLLWDTTLNQQTAALGTLLNSLRVKSCPCWL